LASILVAALTRGVATRRRTAEAVLAVVLEAEVPTFFATVFTGAFFAVAAVFGARLPTLDRYFLFFDFVEGAVVLVGVVVAAPRHTPTATDRTHPTLASEIIL
jgi:hypothetical protein